MTIRPGELFLVTPPRLAEAWGELGTALWDVPTTELTQLARRLRDAATGDPGRAGNVLHAFADMAEAELAWRLRQAAKVPDRTRTA